MSVVSLRLEREKRLGLLPAPAELPPPSGPDTQLELAAVGQQQRQELLNTVRKALYSDYVHLAASAVFDPDARPKLERAIREIVDAHQLALEGMRQERLVQWICWEVAGFGEVIETLLAQPDVTEVIVNRHDQVLITTDDDQTKLTPHRFRSEEELISLIYRICDQGGLTINQREAVQTAILPNGSRLAVSIPPASSYPSMNIRRFVHRSRSAEEQVRSGGLSLEILEFLRVAMAGRANTALVGPTGAGKTSFLEVLLHLIPSEDRIVLVQDNPEIVLPRERDVLSLIATETVGWPQQLEHTLRRKPRWIVPGEVRGPEALTALHAANTGHSLLTTYHANDARHQAVSRFADMCLRALGGGSTSRAEMEREVMVAFDLFILVQRPRSRGNMPTLTEIVEVVDDGQYRQLFRWDHDRCQHERVAWPSRKLLDKLRVHTDVPVEWLGEVGA